MLHDGFTMKETNTESKEQIVFTDASEGLEFTATWNANSGHWDCMLFDTEALAEVGTVVRKVRKDAEAYGRKCFSPTSHVQLHYRFCEREGTRKRFRWFLFESRFTLDELKGLEDQATKRCHPFVSFREDKIAVPDTFEVADSVANVVHIGDGWYKQN